MTLLDQADRLPPMLCVYFARHKGKRILFQEIAFRAGVSRKTISRLSRRGSWKGLRIEAIDKIVAACGIYWSDAWRIRCLIKDSLGRQRPARHLSKRMLKRLDGILATNEGQIAANKILGYHEEETSNAA